MPPSDFCMLKNLEKKHSRKLHAELAAKQLPSFQCKRNVNHWITCEKVYHKNRPYPEMTDELKETMQVTG